MIFISLWLQANLQSTESKTQTYIVEYPFKIKKITSDNVTQSSI